MDRDDVLKERSPTRQIIKSKTCDEMSLTSHVIVGESNYIHKMMNITIIY